MYGLARQLAAAARWASDTRRAEAHRRRHRLLHPGGQLRGDGVRQELGQRQLRREDPRGALADQPQNLEEDSIIDVVDDLAREQAYAFASRKTSAG
jgi:hypothetical protein